MRKRIKRATKQYIIVAFICIIVIGGAAISTSIIMVNQIRAEYKGQLHTLKVEKENNQRKVYVANLDLKAGDCITKDKLVSKMIYATQPKETYLCEEDIGKILLIDIMVGTQMLTSMVTDNNITLEVRESEFSVIHLNSNIIENDTVDIRIVYPNGEDFIVLPKKVLKGITIDQSSCFMWINEEEILRMASAIVDAYLYNGAKIYTTRYIEPNLQEASLITYEPSLATILLIQDNPNIVETAITELSKQVRKALENRLATSYSTSVEEIEWELSPNDLERVEELPAVLEHEEVSTYQEEVEEKEVELDYGP